MSNDDKQIVKIAMNFVHAILSYGEPTPEGLSELYEISKGNKKVLLSHLKAINEITGKAIKALGGVKND